MLRDAIDKFKGFNSVMVGVFEEYQIELQKQVEKDIKVNFNRLQLVDSSIDPKLLTSILNNVKVIVESKKAGVGTPRILVSIKNELDHWLKDTKIAKEFDDVLSDIVSKSIETWSKSNMPSDILNKAVKEKVLS